MRILFVTHLPWVTDLGASGQQVGLASALEEMGHEVTHIAGAEMGFSRPASRLGRVVLDPSPARAAVRATRRSAGQFDVVDGHQGLLPVFAHDLGLRGALVMRSAGLATTYEAWERRARRGGGEGAIAGRPFRAMRRRRNRRDHLGSYIRADLAIAVNGDERRQLEDLRSGALTRQSTSGLPADRVKRLGESARPAAERVAARQVVFVGQWSVRKGSMDWPQIVSRTWDLDPSVRFLFLGTHVDDARFATLLGVSVADDRIEHHASFKGDELADLISGATVALLPSYVEGYPVAPVEAAAAGIPTVAYDTVGTRELSSRLGKEWLVPPGDPQITAERLVAVMNASADEYARTSAMCLTIAEEHSWAHLAPATVRAYESALT